MTTNHEALQADLVKLSQAGKLPATDAERAALATVHSVGISEVTAAVETVVSAHFDTSAQRYLVRSGLDPVAELNTHIQRTNAKAQEDQRRAEATRQWYERNWSQSDYEKYVERKETE